MKLKKKAETHRKKGKRKVNPIIVIVCEGKETEVDYFEGFNSRYTRVDVRIVDKILKGKIKQKLQFPKIWLKKLLIVNYSPLTSLKWELLGQ
ncbi:hypothetical protein CLTEP_28030 [Clostridium tepidiprofundi DSM 19306]|uniref:RloB-like protein n=1 Tax=Clostridium tepidiprofundi DSM 19306 TaxID=1121338 RepID=A0A151AEG3_9CLOT|nr:hypothetical protein [Clostridium tepidiprofundi]KYH25964.1 hypothetical protein CLTEP_28030 [Clostridium tepidiprofundi DSM 19306]